MIKPISATKCIFAATDSTSHSDENKYTDPLLNWPIRGMAFTNEVGEALRPIIGKYATLSWAPALLYFGADIYDKYKNDQTQFNPDSKRALKQAIFQASASVLLPIVAVKCGQDLFSLLGLFSKDKISIKSKEQVSTLAQEFVANGKMRAYRNDQESCIKEFLEIVENNIDYKKQVETTYNPIKKLFLNIENLIVDMCKYNRNNNINEYATKNIVNLINLRKDLLEPSETFKETIHYVNYQEALKVGQTKNVAIKNVLNKFLEGNMMKGKLLKTVGGFITLGISINPIDKFVENVLIGKVVEPKLNK